jgi:hypothetical protein
MIWKFFQWIRKVLLLAIGRRVPMHSEENQTRALVNVNGMVTVVNEETGLEEGLIGVGIEARELPATYNVNTLADVITEFQPDIVTNTDYSGSFGIFSMVANSRKYVVTFSQDGFEPRYIEILIGLETSKLSVDVMIKMNRQQQLL